jgi:sulfite reductase (ferredoxin)
MKSFRTELENQSFNQGKTVVERDIIDLEKKIRLYQEGKMDPEKFRSLRLARGVYGQRQQGVQMVRIKIPLGKISTQQLQRIADIADEYSNGNIHLTTRQDVQIHYVSLDKTPELWEKLERDNITLREACGNTVRNITASSIAGIDAKEAFDITPYAEALFNFFLRNPIQENLGRKFKIAFSSSEEDTAYTFIHDLGFIPKVREVNGTIERGFKVLVAGGLGAQPILAHVASEFLPVSEMIPFAEAAVRVFNHHGERNNRHKARMKYLIAKIGLSEFLKLIEEERVALKSVNRVYEIHTDLYDRIAINPSEKSFATLKIENEAKYNEWLHTNTFKQKQNGYLAVGIRILLGNIPSDKARQLIGIIKKHAADDFRITLNQGFLLRFVPEPALPSLYKELDAIGLAAPGFDSIGDITACPGTDTCNLGISNSTGITQELEKVISNEYSDLLYDKNIKIKISGCMNSCGQHSMAHIGFHGSSIKNGTSIVPALQVLLGGGVLGDGAGRISDKVIKIPSKRGPAVLRTLLNDYETNSNPHESFNDYYDRQGNHYFFRALKNHTDLSTLVEADYIDWNGEEKYKTAVGVGECAGVTIDLVATLLLESDEKIDSAEYTLSEKLYADSIYHSYSAFVQTAKALLLGKDVQANSQHRVLAEFEKHFIHTNEFAFTGDFKEHVLRINHHAPTQEFCELYLKDAHDFISRAKALKLQPTVNAN